jgi:formylglycine-generating enzyme required for sulfatase activity
MVWIPGGTFRMGSGDHYAEEGPVHSVAVDGFWMDRFTTTNADFQKFVEATGYVTVAERSPGPEEFPGAPAENLVPGSMVFVGTTEPVDLRDYTQWWAWTPGAEWRRPTGPRNGSAELEQHPVVQVAYEDVDAYCEWVCREIPTEAEWEFAARGGLDGAEFTWGDDDPQESAPLANTWQGRFPYENTEVDGWTRTSPVGSFPPNAFGLFDMTGNVWEWTSDWYRRVRDAEDDKACCVPENARGGTMEESYDEGQPQVEIPRKVVKGGSHLCTPQYCYRYRPAARQPQMIDTGMSHIGFRCIVRPERTGDV